MVYPFRRILDPIADKLFVACVYIVFGLQAYLPWWLVSLVLGRDVIISGGALAFRWATGHLEMQPLRISSSIPPYKLSY